ncbi:hypothetical protein D3C72_2370640 [compost metagenome]
MAGQIQQQAGRAGVDQHHLVQGDVEQCQLPTGHGAAFEQLADAVVSSTVEVLAQGGQVCRQT